MMVTLGYFSQRTVVVRNPGQEPRRHSRNNIRWLAVLYAVYIVAGGSGGGTQGRADGW